MEETCKTCAFLSQDHENILETEYWAVALSPKQGYLGQCYVNLRQHKGDLAELTDAEWLDFSIVVKKIETAIRDTFHPSLFNWTCLMNNAFQSNSPNPHIHWNVIPRYSNPVIFGGFEFTDPEFGHHYDTKHTIEISVEVLRAATAEIKSHCSKTGV